MVTDLGKLDSRVCPRVNDQQLMLNPKARGLNQISERKREMFELDNSFGKDE